MRIWLGTIAVAGSTALFIASLAGIVASGAFNPNSQFLTLHRHLHVTVGYDYRLEIFSDGTRGPYRGGIIGVSSSRGASSAPTTRAFGDFAGIYYRHFRWPDRTTMWNFSISLFYPLVISMVLPTWSIIRRRTRHRRGFPVQTSSDRRSDLGVEEASGG